MSKSKSLSEGLKPNSFRKTIACSLMWASKCLALAVGANPNDVVKFQLNTSEPSQLKDDAFHERVEWADVAITKRANGQKSVKLENRPKGRTPSQCYNNAYKEWKATGNPPVIGWEGLQVAKGFVLTPHAVNRDKSGIHYDTETFVKKQEMFRFFIPLMTPDESKTFLTSAVGKDIWPFIPTLKWGGLEILEWDGDLHMIETKGQAEIPEGTSYTYVGKIERPTT